MLLDELKIIGEFVYLRSGELQPEFALVPVNRRDQIITHQSILSNARHRPPSWQTSSALIKEAPLDGKIQKGQRTFIPHPSNFIP